MSIKVIIVKNTAWNRTIPAETFHSISYPHKLSQTSFNVAKLVRADIIGRGAREDAVSHYRVLVLSPFSPGSDMSPNSTVNETNETPASEMSNRK